MSDQNDLSGKIGLDVTDFKAAISSINRDIRVVESGFRASAASLGDWSKSASGLESRMKALSSEIELQQKKTGALKSEYEKVAKEKGNNSRAAQELQIKLNKENETLGKMQAELKGTQTSLDNMGKEEKQTKDKTEDLDKSEKKATTSTNQFGTAMKSLTGHLKDVGSGIAAVVGHLAKLAAGLAVGLVAAATGAIVAVGALMVKSAEWAGQFALLSDKTGITTTRLQELDYIGKILDVDITTMTGSMSKLIKNMSSAQEGSGPAAKAFETLGVSIVDSNGQLRNSEEVWTDAITALGGVENATERDALAMEIFGKTALDLNPLIKAGADELAALAVQARAVGAVMSEEDVEALDKFGDSSAAMGNTIKGITGHLAAAFAPALNKAFEALNKFLANPSTQKGLESLRDGISRISSIIVAAFGSSNPFASISAGIDKLGSGSGILNGIGDALGRFAGTFDRLKAGFKSGGIGGLLKSLIPEGGISGMLSGLGGTIGKVMSGMLTSFAAQPAKLLQIGLDIIQGLAKGLLAAIPALLPVVLQLITSLVSFITTTLPTLLQLGLSVVLQLAMGIMQAIPQLIPVVLDMITSLVQFVITNLPMLITAALQLVVTLANGIAAALPTLIPTVVGIIPVIIKTLLENLPMIIKAALNLIMALAQGLIAALVVLIPEVPKIVQMIVDIIVENLPLVIDTALMLITTIVTALIDNLPMIGQAAIDIITALLDGIADLLPIIITAAGEIITTIVKALTDLIPTVLAVGGDIVEGIWAGIQAAWATLLVNMGSIIAGLPEWVKKLLGIASPSKVFADIGKNMALGLGAGFTDSYTKIQQQIGQAIGGLSGQTSMALNGNYAFGGRQMQPAMAPISITIQGVPDKEMDMRRLARYVATEIQRRQT